MTRINTITQTIAVFLVLLTASVAPLYAATPSNGTVTATSTTVQWNGQLYAVAAVAVPDQCPPAIDPVNAICDHFFLNIDLPSNFWAQNTGQVTIRIDWASDLNDFDLFIYNSNGQQVDSSAAGGTTSEVVSLESPDPGIYEVRVVPFLVIASDYKGMATLNFTPGAPTPNPTHPTGGIAFAPAVVIDAQRTEGEPLNFIDKDGNIWETGPWGLSTANSFLHRSTDNGDSYHIASPVQLRPDLPPGGGDTDIIVDDQGFACFNDLELENVGVAVSNDGGNTWRKNPEGIVSAGVDRQWFALDNGLTSGAADNTVFITVRQIPLGLQVFSSPGSTGPADPVGCLIFINAASAPVTIAPDAVCGQPRFEPVKRNLYLVCNRGSFVEIIRGHVDPGQRIGIVFTRQRAPNSPGGSVGDLFPAMTFDTAGNIYAVWVDSNNHNVYLSASSSEGTTGTWTSPIQVNGDPANTNDFPWAAAGAPGIVDVVFYGTSRRGDADFFPSWFNNRQAASHIKWFPYLAQVRLNFTNPTSSTIYQVQATSHPTHYGQICNLGLGCTISDGDRSMADFFAVALDSQGAARIVYDDTTNQHHGAALFEARQIAGPGANGTPVTGTAPTNPMSDPSDDAQWPHYFPVTGPGTNQAHMDFLTLELSQIGSNRLKVRMVVQDASSLLPPPGAQSTVWLTRWQALALGDDGEESHRIFYVGAKSVAGGSPTFFSGTGTSASNDGVMGNGCITNTPRNCKIVLYPQEKSQAGSFNSATGEIIIEVPLADVGGSSAGDILYSVTALSLGEVSVDPLFQDVDATRAFDFPLQTQPVTLRKVTGGGYIHVDPMQNKGRFSLVAHTDLKGKVSYVDDALAMQFRSTMITELTIQGNKATIKGTGFANNVQTTFTVIAEDKAESGRGQDTFSIELGTGYSKSGVLQAGNIQIH
jgi:hypothetical protein